MRITTEESRVKSKVKATSAFIGLKRRALDRLADQVGWSQGWGGNRHLSTSAGSGGRSGR